MNCNAKITPGGNRNCPKGHGLVAPSYCARVCGADLVYETPEPQPKFDRAYDWAITNRPDLVKTLKNSCCSQRSANRAALEKAYADSL